MAQISWRCPDGLAARVRLQADHFGLSMNEFISRVMQTATDPGFDQDPASQVRERLRLAGLLAEDAEESHVDAPDPVAAAEAAKALGGGTLVSEIVIRDR